MTQAVLVIRRKKKLAGEFSGEGLLMRKREME